MGWSLNIGRVGDTVLRVHLTFFLLLLWIGSVGYAQGGLPAALDGILFVILVFACVVLHEFGHVLAAKRYGIRTPDVTVLPIGGLARLEKMPDKPVQELVVALAGPAVNVVIALVLFLLLGARFDLNDVSNMEEIQSSLQARLVAVNVMLVVFNLLPAFPLDGGRVFRALLGFRFPRAKATLYAARTGQAFAVLFAIVGLYTNPFLILIAVFMYFAAESEASHEGMRAQASRHTARDAMVTRFESLSPVATADDAANLLILTTQQEFPVISMDGRVRGFVTRAGLVDALARHGGATPVTEFMEAATEALAPDTPLEKVMEQVYASPARAVAVMRAGGSVMGYVSAENASELFMLDRARDAGASGGAGGGAGGAGRREDTDAARA